MFSKKGLMMVAALSVAGVMSMPCVLVAGEPGKAPPPEPAAATEWKVLCDGKSLKDWKKTQFGGEGGVKSVDGAIVMDRGGELTGINWGGAALPKRNYEIVMDSKRVDGSDFFCGVVFPVGDDFCSFVAGGWGGSVVGLSAIDGMYADENSTASRQSFDDNRWYRIRLRVSEKYIQVWIDEKRVINLETNGKKITTHPAVDALKPLGVSCYSTEAAVKNIRIRDLTKEEATEVPKE